jgi:hypothetical protein
MTWSPLNKGVELTFAPELPEGQEHTYGHDPHCVMLHPQRPDRLWRQDHCGIYRMDRDKSDRWERVGRQMPKDVGDIGFPDRRAPARSRHGVGVPHGRHRRVAAHEPEREARRVPHERRRGVVGSGSTTDSRASRRGGR